MTKDKIEIEFTKYLTELVTGVFTCSDRLEDVMLEVYGLSFASLAYDIEKCHTFAWRLLQTATFDEYREMHNIIFKKDVTKEELISDMVQFYL